MKYINASDLLPPALVQTLQEYVQGGYVYIPAREHKGWGEKSGSREAFGTAERRNPQPKAGRGNTGSIGRNIPSFRVCHP